MNYDTRGEEIVKKLIIIPDYNEEANIEKTV